MLPQDRRKGPANASYRKLGSHRWRPRDFLPHLGVRWLRRLRQGRSCLAFRPRFPRAHQTPPPLALQQEQLVDSRVLLLAVLPTSHHKRNLRVEDIPLEARSSVGVGTALETRFGGQKEVCRTHRRVVHSDRWSAHRLPHLGIPKPGGKEENQRSSLAVETWNDTVSQTVKLIDKMHAQIMRPLDFSPLK